MHVFYFDTSALARLHNYFSRELFPDLWELIDALFTNGQAVSHEIVLAELNPRSKAKDALAIWANDRSESFMPMTQFQVDMVPKILRKFPNLIEIDAERNQADPWIVALALQESMTLQGAQKSHWLVSEESLTSSKTIPAVCKEFGIRHLSLKEFFVQQQITFGVKRAED